MKYSAINSTHAGSPFCSKYTTFPLNVSISCGLFTTCIPVFSLGEDTPLTVSTLTPVSVDRTVSMESIDTLADDFTDVPLPWLSVRAFIPALFTFLASLLTAPTTLDTLFALEAIVDWSEVLFTETQVPFTVTVVAFVTIFVPELLVDREIVLASSCLTEALATETAVLWVSAPEEFPMELFTDSISLALVEFDWTLDDAGWKETDSSIFWSFGLKFFVFWSFTAFWILFERCVAEPVLFVALITLFMLFTEWLVLLLFEWPLTFSVGTGESFLLSVPPFVRPWLPLDLFDLEIWRLSSLPATWEFWTCLPMFSSFDELEDLLLDRSCWLFVFSDWLFVFSDWLFLSEFSLSIRTALTSMWSGWTAVVAVVFTTLDVPVALEVCFKRSIRCRSTNCSVLEFFSLAWEPFDPESDCLLLWVDSFVCPLLIRTSLDPLSIAFLFFPLAWLGMLMNLAGFKTFELALFVFSGIFDGDTTRSLPCVFPGTETFSCVCFFPFQAFLDGDAANFCCFAGDNLADSFERSLFLNCGVLSGFVGVPWIGESLLTVFEACRRVARFVTLLLFPEAFKRFLESVVLKRVRESTRRPSFGEARRSVDLLKDVERWRVGCGIRLLLGLFCCDTETGKFRLKYKKHLFFPLRIATNDDTFIVNPFNIRYTCSNVSNIEKNIWKE